MARTDTKSRWGLTGLLSGTLVLGGLVGLVAPILPAHAASTCDSNLCLTPSQGSTWEAGRSSTAKERAKRSTKNGGTLSLTIDGGRGSVFINGRYLGTAPLHGVDVPRGRNDLQVRDGAEVLASGVLQVSSNADLEIVVRHL